MLRSHGSSSRWSLPSFGNQSAWLFMVFVILLVFNACSASGPKLTTEIDADDLPAGIGRGFPAVSLHGIDNAGTALTPGAVPPNFNMTLDDGRYISLANLKGRPVMINFWATWCGPCRLEMPEIVAEANRNQDLVVLAINVQEELTQLQPFAEDFAMTMPVVLDSDATLRQLYEVSGMPTSVFIDTEGKIATIWRGILTPDSLHQFVAQIEQ